MLFTVVSLKLALWIGMVQRDTGSGMPLCYKCFDRIDLYPISNGYGQQ